MPLIHNLLQVRFKESIIEKKLKSVLVLVLGDYLAFILSIIETQRLIIFVLCTIIQSQIL